MQATRPRLAALVPRSRPLPTRKRLLFDSYAHLLTRSRLVLFLRPGDLTAHEWAVLRASLPSASLSPSAAAAATPPLENDDDGVKLTVLRPGLLPALLRSSLLPPSFDPSLLSAHPRGPLAVLSSPTLHPPTLLRLLALLHAASLAPSQNAASPSPSEPGTPQPERLPLLSALLEHRAMDPDATHRVAALPALDVLRAQVVALLALPASRIGAVVGARARDVGRTVEGFREGLREASAASP